MELKPDTSATPASEAGGDDQSSESGAELEWREYLFFREEMRHEDNLINQRVSWLISSQAFLLGGFATLIGAGPNTLAGSLGGLKNAMLLGLPIAGILGVLTNYVTLLAAVWHVWGVKKFVANRRTGRMPSLHNWHTLQLRMGLFGPLTAPLIFLGFWIVILVKLR
jgi:hypothetical protein